MYVLTSHALMKVYLKKHNADIGDGIKRMLDVRVNILSFILKPGQSKVLFELYLFRHLRRKGGKSSLLIVTQNMDPRASLTSRQIQGYLTSPT